ncbi:MAG: hypothetical protein Q7T89_07690 [Anaerolineales bacterium]|nr:hypothetical protein [Anaerolineales bacterium]
MSLLKPTTKTPFHIDFDWWKKNERDWHIFLRSLLCTEHQQAFAETEEGGMIDWVDPKTAEVKQVDGIQHALMSHCALLPGFSDSHTAMVEAVFRIFLVNGNVPMSADDIAKRLERPADTILRTISGARVYRGLRPYQQNVPNPVTEDEV